MTELDRKTLPALINNSYNKFADNNSLSYYDELPKKYHELYKIIGSIAMMLQKQGITHGDRVAILSENCPNWGIAYFAITSFGAVAVPILPEFHATEVHHILRHSETKAIFISDRYFSKIEDKEFENLHTRILIDNFSIIQPNSTKEKVKQLLIEGEYEIRKLINKAKKFAGFKEQEVQEDDIASIIYTSGTTGHSKGVMLTHKNIVSNALATEKLVSPNENDRMLSLLPLAHVYECTLGMVVPLMVGGAVYYLRKPPTATVLLPALEAVKPTIILSVPLIIEKMYKAKILPEINKKAILRFAYKFASVRKKINAAAGKKLLKTFGGELRLFCIGGSALASEVENFLIEAKFPYAIGYGLTETSPLVAGTDAFKTKFRSTGPALDGVEIKIDNPNPSTGEGEILVRGDIVMKGYYKDPEKTAEVFTNDGWFKTGDLGVFDENNFLYIKGRSKNVILGASGENIYPEIIESVINRNESVLESLVFKLQGLLVARVHLNYEKLDEYFTEKKLNAKQVREHINHILDDIKKQVNESVASFSRINKVIEQTEPFEKTPTQKIKRFLYVDAEFS